LARQASVTATGDVTAAGGAADAGASFEAVPPQAPVATVEATSSRRARPVK
jgi:hypothetical protein